MEHPFGEAFNENSINIVEQNDNTPTKPNEIIPILANNQNEINCSPKGSSESIGKTKIITQTEFKPPKEPEPIPIFSCIYCVKEYVVFSSLSRHLLSKKYYTNNIPPAALSCSRTIGPSQNFTAENLSFGYGNDKDLIPNNNNLNINRRQTFDEKPSLIDLQLILSMENNLVCDKSKNSSPDQVQSKSNLLEIINQKTEKLYIPQLNEDKAELRWLVQKMYISKKDKAAKCATTLFYDKSISSNLKLSSLLKTKEIPNHNSQFLQSSLKRDNSNNNNNTGLTANNNMNSPANFMNLETEPAAKIFEIDDKNDDKNNDKNNEISFSSEEHDIYNPNFDNNSETDETFIENELKKARNLKLSEPNYSQIAEFLIGCETDYSTNTFLGEFMPRKITTHRHNEKFLNAVIREKINSNIMQTTRSAMTSIADIVNNSEINTNSQTKIAESAIVNNKLLCPQYGVSSRKYTTPDADFNEETKMLSGSIHIRHESSSSNTPNATLQYASSTISINGPYSNNMLFPLNMTQTEAPTPMKTNGNQNVISKSTSVQHLLAKTRNSNGVLDSRTTRVNYSSQQNNNRIAIPRTFRNYNKPSMQPKRVRSKYVNMGSKHLVNFGPIFNKKNTSVQFPMYNTICKSARHYENLPSSNNVPKINIIPKSASSIKAAFSPILARSHQQQTRSLLTPSVPNKKSIKMIISPGIRSTATFISSGNTVVLGNPINTRPVTQIEKNNNNIPMKIMTKCLSSYRPIKIDFINSHPHQFQRIMPVTSRVQTTARFNKK